MRVRRVFRRCVRRATRPYRKKHVCAPRGGDERRRPPARASCFDARQPARAHTRAPQLPPVTFSKILMKSDTLHKVLERIRKVYTSLDINNDGTLDCVRQKRASRCGEFSLGFARARRRRASRLSMSVNDRESSVETPTRPAPSAFERSVDLSPKSETREKPDRVARRKKAPSASPFPSRHRQARLRRAANHDRPSQNRGRRDAG